MRQRISPRIARGSAELAVLALLAQQPLHGYEIARRIEQHTGGALRFTLASLYPLLYELERRGWVKGSWQTTGQGRRRRYYRLMAAGKKKLAPLRREWGLFFRALDCLTRVARA